MENFGKTLSKLNQTNKKFYVAGDFNLNLLKQSTDNKINQYCDFLNSFNCFCTVDKPTRVTS